MTNQIEQKFCLYQPSDLDVFALEFELAYDGDSSKEKELHRKLVEARLENRDSVLGFHRENTFVGHVGYNNLALSGSDYLSEVAEKTPVIRLMAVSGRKTFGAYAALRILHTREALEYFCAGADLDEYRGAYEAFKKVLPEGELPVLFFEGCFMEGNSALFNSLWLMAIQFAMRQGVCAIVAIEDHHFIQDIEGEKLVWSEALGLCGHGPFIHEEEPDESAPEAMKIVPRASFSQACDKLVEQGAIALEWLGEVPAEFKDLA